MSLHRQEQMHRELGQMNVRLLLSQLEAEAEIKSSAASKALAEKMTLDSDDEDDEKTKLRKRRQRKERLLKRLEEKEERDRFSSRNRQLWVDKYSPRNYADLLSPEQINREVLEWIKRWSAQRARERERARASE